MNNALLEKNSTAEAILLPTFLLNRRGELFAETPSVPQTSSVDAYTIAYFSGNTCSMATIDNPTINYYNQIESQLQESIDRTRGLSALQAMTSVSSAASSVYIVSSS